MQGSRISYHSGQVSPEIAPYPTLRRPMDYELPHLKTIEAESIHIMREVAAEFERPVLLFSGGKDSVVMLHVASKAFWPCPLPFAVMHVDTGHNFSEVIEFRDRAVEAAGARLVVASVEESIRLGRVVDETGPKASRNRLQTTTLLDAIEEHRFDAVFGGARRDEEKARAKERVYSFRDEFGQWDPKNQRPELWSLYNGRHKPGEHIRVFPLSNWTELDIWQYIEAENIELPSIYYAHRRQVFRRDGMLLAVSPFVTLDGRRRGVRGARAVPHGRRRDVHRCRRIERDHDRRRHRRGGRHPDHRTRCHSGRRPHIGSGHGRPQEGRVFLSVRTSSVGDSGFGRRRQVDAHRSPALRLEGDLRGPTRGRRAHLSRTGRRVHQPGVAHRWSSRRARAGDHDRRGVSLLRHPEAQVHHRRHAGPHSVHAEHGHRLLHRRSRHGADRCPQRHPRAVAAPCLPRVAASRAALGALRQQDGSRRLRLRHLRVDQRRVQGLRQQARHHRPDLHPDLGAPGRQRRASQREHAVVRGCAAAPPPRRGVHRVRPQSDRCSLPGAVRVAADERQVPRLPWLRRHRRGWGAQGRRRGHGAAFGSHVHREVDRDRRRSDSTRRSRRWRSRSRSPTTST